MIGYGKRIENKVQIPNLNAAHDFGCIFVASLYRELYLYSLSSPIGTFELWFYLAGTSVPYHPNAEESNPQRPSAVTS